MDFNFTYNLAGQLVHEDNTRVEPGVGGAAATNKKKNIDYRYDGAGQLIEIRDNYLGQTTRYEYDLAGNRVAEKMSQKTLLTSGLLDDVVYQDNHLVYDAQHRLRAVFDGRSDVRITYDLAGNRWQVKTHVINTIRTTTDQGGLQERQVVHTDTTDFQYDAMNRQTGSQQKSSVNGAVETHTYEYDLAGNRTLDKTVTNGQTKTYSYTYDDLHRIDYYRGDGASDQMDHIRYDGAGRQVAARTLIGETGGSYEYRYSQYDATGKLQDVHTVVRSSKTGDNQKVSQTYNVAYHDAGGVTGLGYDAAGNLKGVRQDADGQVTTTTYQYTYLNGSWQQSAALTRRGGDVVGTITQRDANGFVVGIRQPKVTGSAAQAPDGSLAAALTNQATQATSNDARYDRTFVNDANGTAVFVSQGGFNAQGEVNSSIANPASGYQGGVTGSALTPGHVQRQLVANGEVLARYGDAPTQEENTPQTNNPAYVDTADFRLQAAQIRPRHKSLDPVAYTVVGGETLKDIARNVLGDASLWWRIADANSLAVSGDGALTAGQTLTVPKLALNANSVETFQPYDPSQAMGSMDPVLPVPANGGGCGAIGQIIMIVVAVVVAYVTAGAAAGMLGSAFQAVGAAGVTIGGVTLNATGAFIASAIGGAVGSIASQAVGIAIGAQSDFSWKGVALSALGGGISSGLAGTQLLGGSDFGVSVARAAVGNALSQGIGVVTGLQDRFDWKGVVASAAGAGVGWGMNQALGLTDANGMPTNMPNGVEKFARAGLSGFAAGMTAAVMRGGRISVQQVATDAFGHALGDAVSEAMRPDPLGDFIKQQEAAQMQRDRYAMYDFGGSGKRLASVGSSYRGSVGTDMRSVDPASGTGLQQGGYLGLGISSGAVRDWSQEVNSGIESNGSRRLTFAQDTAARRLGAAPAWLDNWKAVNAAQADPDEARRPRTYTVQAGDSPAKIGRMFYGDERAGAAVMAASGMDASVKNARGLQVGQVVNLPEDIGDANLKAGGRLIGADSALRAQQAAAAQAARQAAAAQQATAANAGMGNDQTWATYMGWGGRSASYAGLTPTWSGRMVEVPGSGVDIMGNATGAPNQVWVSDGPATPYAESVGKAVPAAASLASGLATLTVAGIYNQVVKIGSGVASIPFLPAAGMDAAIGVQKNIQEDWGWNPTGQGVDMVMRGMAPVARFTNDVMTDLRGASERTLGDGATTALFAGAQVVLEAGGAVAGLRAVGAVAESIMARFSSTGAFPSGAGMTKLDVAAEQAYQGIRDLRMSDVQAVAANTGLSLQDATTMKKHLFFGRHEYPIDGDTVVRARFVADHEIAYAWRTASAGPLTEGQSAWFNQLAQHELSERGFMAQGVPYLQREAWTGSYFGTTPPGAHNFAPRPPRTTFPGYEIPFSLME
ncbi:LysM peptidoglycan-binding domain-containing protein [Paracidovorax avenae]|uniref:LysM peptidoglycan-binding domain-containing protein n=1 Tax=Paracidovorax avenae TaxID=80867 RepID=UPI001F3A5410|nr:LysM peptidoglycan-binding domain-containing protein [Paracidovorax avenae]